MTPPAYRAQMRYHITPIIAENDRWLAIKWHYKNNFCFYHILWLAVVIALRSGYANKQLMEQTKKKMEEQILESAIGIPQFRQQRSKCQITTNHIIYKYCESNTRNAKIKMLIIYRNTKKPTSWYLFVSAFPIFFLCVFRCWSYCMRQATAQFVQYVIGRPMEFSLWALMMMGHGPAHEEMTTLYNVRCTRSIY